MDVEFKLFGSLTIKQFVGLAIWFFFALVVYLMGLPPIIGYPLIGIFIFLGIAFAFIRVNDQPFSKWLGNFLLAMFSPQRKIWKRSNKVPKALTQDFHVPKKVKNPSGRKIGNLSEEDIDQIISKNQPKNIGQYEDKIFDNIDRYIKSDSGPNSIIENFKENNKFKLEGSQDSKNEVIPKPVDKTVEKIDEIHEVTKVKEFKLPEVSEAVPNPKPVENTVPIPENKKEPEEIELPEVPDTQEKVEEELASGGNRVSGTVWTKDGDKFPNVTVIIRDSKNTIVRQVDTNLEGVFFIKTPLPSNVYDIAAEIKGGSQFQNISLSLNGNIEKVVNLYEV